MSKYDTLLLDIDGTVLDFLAAEKAAIQTLFPKYGFGTCTDEMVEQYSRINVRYWEALERGEITKPEVLVGRYREFFTLLGLPVEKAEAFNSDYQMALGDTVVFCDDCLPLLKELGRKYTLAAVTNGTYDAQHKKLTVSGLYDVFHRVFISEQVGVEKPGKAFFDHVFRELGITDPERVLIVGDSLTSDIRGGNNVGIDTCWYNPAGKCNDKAVSVTYEIRDLHELFGILENGGPVVSLLDNTYNARDLGGYPLMNGRVTRTDAIWRSSAPRDLTEKDIVLLKRHHITTDIDMRTETAAERLPDPLKDDPDVDYHFCPIEEGAYIPESVAAVPVTYMMIAEAPNMAEVFHILAEAPAGVLVHCSAGKDRTGVVCAVLLMLCGAADETIIRDYSRSRYYNWKDLQKMLAALPEVDPEIVMAREETMKEFLRLFRERFGTAERYLTGLGLTEVQIGKIINRIAGEIV